MCIYKHTHAWYLLNIQEAGNTGCLQRKLES